ncbi:MAG: hypothetical protein ACTSRG_07990 [Candidatus Helarchaeota archaeon]
MRSKIIDKPVESCIERVLEYFNKIINESETLFKSFLPKTTPLTYTRVDELEIKFEKLFPYYFGYRLSNKASKVKGTIWFEGDKETKINIAYNRRGLFALCIFTLALIISMFYIMILMPLSSFFLSISNVLLVTSLSFMSMVIFVMIILSYFADNFNKDEKTFANQIFQYISK